MKLISLQKNLKAAVYAVNHIAQKNTNLPILNNILLSAKDGMIKLVSTNLEIGITSLLRGKIESEGSFTIDARLFSDYVNLLPNEKVSVELKDNELVVECGENRTRIKGMSAEEFPFIPDVERVSAYTIPMEAFKRAVGQVIFAAAMDEARAELSGILAVLSDKELVMAATDSYRLAEKRVPVVSSVAGEERRCIIPARTLQEVIRVIGVDSGDESEATDIVLYVSDSQCLFVVGGTEIVSRLIEGRYPDYQQIIPVKQTAKASVDRQELSRAIKAAAIFSKTGVNDVSLAFDAEKKTLKVSAGSGQAGDHVSTLGATVSGEAVSIILNSRYLLDVLATMESETAALEVVDGDTPCIMRDGDGKNSLYIIMPIRK